jgi:hypothetical protein
LFFLIALAGTASRVWPALVSCLWGQSTESHHLLGCWLQGFLQVLFINLGTLPSILCVLTVSVFSTGFWDFFFFFSTSDLCLLSN